MNILKTLWRICGLTLLAGGITGAALALTAPQDTWYSFAPAWTLSATPRALAVAPDGTLLVGVATTPQKVRRYTAAGTQQSEFGSFTSIVGIATDAAGNVYVYDGGSSRVQVFTPAGVFVRSFGSSGAGNGQMASSTIGSNKIALDAAGSVFLADEGNRRVQKFDSSGAYVTKWDGTGSPAGVFTGGPYGLRLMPGNRVVVAALGTWQAVARLRYDLFDTAAGTYVTGFITSSASTSSAFFALPDGVFGPTNSSSQWITDDLTAITSPITTFTGIFATDAQGRIFRASGTSVTVHHRAIGGVENAPTYNALPQPAVIAAEQRPGTTFMDVDYIVTDPDDATVQVAALGFVNGGNDLASVLPLKTFVEGTEANLGTGQATNTPRRFTWNAAADWATDFGQVQVEVLAKDGRGLYPFRWVTIPATETAPAFQVSDRPLPDADLMSLWYWLVATGDSVIRLEGGKLYGTEGRYEKRLLADSVTTTQAGRLLLMEKAGVRSIIPLEMSRARSGRFGLSSLTQSSVVLGFKIERGALILSWGENSSLQSTVPNWLSDVRQIAVGYNVNIVLHNNGSVTAFGDSSYSSLMPPNLTGVQSVAAGLWHALALKDDGMVVGWGPSSGDGGASKVPSDLNNVIAIAAGRYFSLALLNSGVVRGWGLNSNGQLNAPQDLNNVTAIAAGETHSLALRFDGSVVGWGGWGNSMVPVGLNSVIAIAAGRYHSLALKSDGTVVAWGSNTNGQTTVPAGLTGVRAIAAGDSHSLALKNDGTVVAWGSNTIGQTTVPAGLTSIDRLATGSSANHVVVLDLP